MHQNKSSGFFVRSQTSEIYGAGTEGWRMEREEEEAPEREVCAQRIMSKKFHEYMKLIKNKTNKRH